MYDSQKASLDDWLRLVFTPESERRVLVADYCFPTDAHAEEYLAGIQSRSEIEVKALIRKFLVPMGTLGHDHHIVAQYAAQPEIFKEDFKQFEYTKRLIRRPVWEGLTWILDLLPHHPQDAIDVANAYFVAHARFLPDERMQGLNDVENIIRARYLHQSHPQEVLSGLSDRDFEFLVASVYRELGYRVVVTGATRDGGCDVRAYRDDAGSKEALLIECKLHRRKLVVKEIRSFVGVVETEKVNRGILVAPNGFTGAAVAFAAQARRVELVDYSVLNRLLNQTEGADWPRYVGQIIAMQKSSNDRRSSDESIT